MKNENVGKTTKRTVEVTLTKTELAEKGLLLAKETKHLGQLTIKKERVMKVFKNKIASSEDEIIRLSDVIDKGIETRQMDVVCVKDFERKMKFYYDAEGVLVDREPFTDYDHQTSIDDYLDTVFAPPSEDDLANLEIEIQERERRKREQDEAKEREYDELANLADATAKNLDDLKEGEQEEDDDDAPEPDQTDGF
jgi:hypothetical protein